MATYQVTQAGAGTTDGSSLANAKSMAGINGTTLAPGDIVVLNGTITSTLTISDSGSSGNVITYRFASGASFSKGAWGTDSTSAIYANGKSYFTIDGQSVGIVECTTNGDGLAIQQDSHGISIDSCNNVIITALTIRNVYVHIYNTDNVLSPYSTRCLNVNNTSNITISYCTTSNSYVGLWYVANGATITGGALSYCILSAHSTAVVPACAGSLSDIISSFTMDHCDVTMGLNWFDTPDGNHIDGLHSFTTLGQITTMTISNNYFHGDPSTNATSYISISDNSLDTRVFNNLIVGSTNRPNGAYISWGSASSVTDFRVYNNTIVGISTTNTGGTAIFIDPTAARVNWFCKNNIITNVYIAYYIVGRVITFDTDYNDVYGFTSYAYDNSVFIDDLTAWKAVSGGDVHTIETDPLLDGSYNIISTSPCRDAATSLNAFFTTDRLRVSRPQGIAWDMGAYEFPVPESLFRRPNRGRALLTTRR